MNKYWRQADGCSFRLICVVAAFALLPGVGITQPDLSLEINAGQVTITADSVPLAVILTEIARQSHLRMELHGSFEQRISIKLRQLPLAKALNRILRTHDFALQYRPQSGSGQLWAFSREAESGLGSGKATISEFLPGAMSESEQMIASLSFALTGENRDASLQAIAELADIGGDEAAVALTAALQNTDAAVREEGAHALGEIAGEVAIQALQQALQDQQTDVREAAIAALAEIGGDQATRLLGNALNDPVSSLRQDLLYALAEIGSDTAIDLIRQALVDQQATVRETADEILSELSVRVYSPAERNWPDNSR